MIYLPIEERGRMIEQTTEMDRILLGNTRDLKEVRVSGHNLKEDNLNISGDKN